MSRIKLWTGIKPWHINKSSARCQFWMTTFCSQLIVMFHFYYLSHWCFCAHLPVFLWVPVGLTFEVRIFVFRCGGEYVKTMLNQRFLDMDVSHWSAVRNLIKKFRKTGSATNALSPEVNLRKWRKVRRYFWSYSSKSKRIITLAQQAEISNSSAHRALTKHLHHRTK